MYVHIKATSKACAENSCNFRCGKASSSGEVALVAEKMGELNVGRLHVNWAVRMPDKRHPKTVIWHSPTHTHTHIDAHELLASCLGNSKT